MGRRSAGSESRRQQDGLNNFFFAGTRLFCALRVNLDAIDTLRRVRNGNRNEFPVFRARRFHRDWPMP